MFRGPLNLRHGLTASPADPRTVKLADYLHPTRLPTPPRDLDWGAKVDAWGMFLNDQVGICGPAAAAHLEMQMSSNVQARPTVPSDTSVLAEYSALSGYNPQTGANDNGVNLLAMLKRWRSVGLWGDKITAFVHIDPRNAEHVQFAFWAFGGLIVAAALPRAAEGQFRAGEPWTCNAFPWGAYAPGSWGLHALMVRKRNASEAGLVTWGTTQRASLAWWDAYVTECWAALSPDWINGAHESPAGLDYDHLVSDLSLL